MRLDKFFMWIFSGNNLHEPVYLFSHVTSFMTDLSQVKNVSLMLLLAVKSNSLQMIHAELQILRPFNLPVKTQVVDVTPSRLDVHRATNAPAVRKCWGDTHVAAGVWLMTSMTYAPEVTSGKSDCLDFSSVASLSGGKQNDVILIHPEGSEPRDAF